MLGYYKNPEATSQIIDVNGWLHTGDLGTMDAEGYVTVRGRSKNMLLTSSGQNIYPEEIESKLNNMPVSYTHLDVYKRQTKLKTHPWYGNIRELEHAIEKAVIICDGNELPAELFQLPKRPETSRTGSDAGTEAATLEEMERKMIQKALDTCNGNLSAVAAQLGITRQTLYNKMKKFGL